MVYFVTKLFYLSVNNPQPLIDVLIIFYDLKGLSPLLKSIRLIKTKIRAIIKFNFLESVDDALSKLTGPD